MITSKTCVVTEKTEWARTIIECLGLSYSIVGQFYQALADRSEAALVIQTMQDQGIRAGHCESQLTC
jgi:hypothetical protein